MGADRLRYLGGILGLFPEYSAEALPAAIIELGTMRQKAKESRDFAKADDLRNQIRQAGFSIEDTPSGQRIFPSKR